MITAQRIGYEISEAGVHTWHVADATSLQDLPGAFLTATEDEVKIAMEKAWQAFPVYQDIPVSVRAEFLREIADNIEALGDMLVRRVMQESALAEARVRSERARTTGQLRMFADLIIEGSWVEAIIDHGDPARTPPKPDLRRMLQPIGPIVVFGASNFPLAYSTAGGDTASALAAGCPVVVKAHEAHAGTNALVAEAIIKAAQETGMPDGVFSTVYARGFEVGKQLVTHPITKGVGFTGSRAGGRALFDLASNRESPIPVFAEMSSINPIFLLPDTLQQNAESIATQIAASVNLGAGQFCTCPGLIIALDDDYTKSFIEFLVKAFSAFPSLTMLHAGIQQNYSKNKTRFFNTHGVRMEFHVADERNGQRKAGPAIASVSAEEFLSNESLQDEVFGPFTLLIKCRDMHELKDVASHIQGQLTASIYGTAQEVQHSGLTELLKEKAGRLVFNGVPTGVEVCSAMVHGGPYPATTDSRFTAVGAPAIKRWIRPVAFQNCPDTLLPDALKEENPLGIWRVVDGQVGER